jgi:Tol biopolymer transport system component
MKKLLLFMAAIILSIKAIPQNKFEYKIANAIPITEEGEYSAPNWSPDGNNILITTARFNGLYLINVSKNNFKKLNNEEFKQKK